MGRACGDSGDGAQGSAQVTWSPQAPGAHQHGHTLTTDACLPGGGRHERPALGGDLV